MGLGQILAKRVGYGLVLLIAVVVLSVGYSVWMELRTRPQLPDGAGQ